MLGMCGDEISTCTYAHIYTHRHTQGKHYKSLLNTNFKKMANSSAIMPLDFFFY